MKTLDDRAQSGFPLSIGTSISLETLFTPVQDVYDDSRVVDNLEDLSTYSLYVFNVSTILRNLINSVPYATIATVSRQVILDTLLSEIEFLTNFFATNNIDISFYINNYNFVHNTYDSKKLRRATTDKQVHIDSLFRYCLGKIEKEDDVTLFTKDIKYKKEDSVLLFTHVPFDLLSYSNFIKMDLLESHTGVIKTRKSWNSKYFPIPGKDMSFLPFFEYLLTTFGDHVMFHPSSMEERIKVYTMMVKKKVNPLTREFSLEYLK